MRRRWSKKLGGYTYDGVKLTKCQCNTSAGGCKCGNFEKDKREAERENTNTPQEGVEEQV